MPALRPAAACLVLACALVPSITSSEVRASPSPMVDKINHLRNAHGMPALRYSPRLARSSSGFARHLLRTDRFAHGGWIMTGGRFSRLGEILALTGGWRLQRGRTLGYWLGSQSHRTVLLSSSFRYVGAGAARGWFAGRRNVAWTVRFGR